MSGTTIAVSDTAEGRTRRMRWVDAVGLLCVVAALVLVSGIRIARAEEPMMSVDPALLQATGDAETRRANPPAAVAPTASPASPMIVPLNTRGFNYRMQDDGEVDPASLRFEARTPPADQRGR